MSQRRNLPSVLFGSIAIFSLLLVFFSFTPAFGQNTQPAKPATPPANLLAPIPAAPLVTPPAPEYEFNDSHFHLTNYIQKGIKAKELLEIMGTQTGRVAIFGIPLQQTWSFQNSGNFAPRYYTESDAPLYYYSFTDAYIAKVIESLTPEQRARFDPMITGFNPADMYAVDHVERVLHAYPGVFTGIGEFSIHKEFVSSKVAGENATLQIRSVHPDRIFSRNTQESRT